MQVASGKLHTMVTRLDEIIIVGDAIVKGIKRPFTTPPPPAHKQPNRSHEQLKKVMTYVTIGIIINTIQYKYTTLYKLELDN